CKEKLNSSREVDLIMTNKQLDSLGKYPQGSVENDLFYEIYIKKYPDVAEAWKGKSISYNKRGDYAKGFKYLNKAVELNPIDHLGYRGWVKLYMMHDYKGALNDFLSLADIAGDKDLYAWGENLNKLIGLCYLKIKKYDLALNYLNKSILEITEKSGEDWVAPRTYLYLGIVYGLLSDDKNAIEVFNKLNRIYPRFSEGYFYKVKCLIQSGEYELAEHALKDCKEK